MSADELASLASLSDDHRKVLAEELGVATCRALVLARRPLIVEAMRRPEVTIDAVWLVDRDGEREVPGEADPTRAQLSCTDETRLAVAVTAPRGDQLVTVCVRIYERGSVGWTLPDPLEIKGSGRATFALSGLPVGRHVGSWVLAAAPGSGPGMRSSQCRRSNAFLHLDP